MSVRTEQTLRRMWDESLKLQSEAGKLWAEADRAQADALAAEQVAAAHRTAEEKSRDVSTAMSAEAADLVDMVNEKRVQAGLSPLTQGEPYPVDPVPAGQPTADDTLVASAQSSVETATDGHLDTREVGS